MGIIAGRGLTVGFWCWGKVEFVGLGSLVRKGVAKSTAVALVAWGGLDDDQK